MHCVPTNYFSVDKHIADNFVYFGFWKFELTVNLGSGTKISMPTQPKPAYK